MINEQDAALAQMQARLQDAHVSLARLQDTPGYGDVLELGKVRVVRVVRLLKIQVMNRSPVGG
jgi:hypothetical protein